MRFEPAVIAVRKGEQIRFLLENGGTESREFSGYGIFQRRGVRCSACIGGQGSEPYEQNTQQCPDLGFRRSPQPLQS